MSHAVFFLFNTGEYTIREKEDRSLIIGSRDVTDKKTNVTKSCHKKDLQGHRITVLISVVVTYI